MAESRSTAHDSFMEQNANAFSIMKPMMELVQLLYKYFSNLEELVKHFTNGELTTNFFRQHTITLDHYLKPYQQILALRDLFSIEDSLSVKEFIERMTLILSSEAFSKFLTACSQCMANQPAFLAFIEQVLKQRYKFEMNNIIAKTDIFSHLLIPARMLTNLLSSLQNIQKNASFRMLETGFETQLIAFENALTNITTNLEFIALINEITHKLLLLKHSHALSSQQNIVINNAVSTLKAYELPGEGLKEQRLSLLFIREILASVKEMAKPNPLSFLFKPAPILHMKKIMEQTISHSAFNQNVEKRKEIMLQERNNTRDNTDSLRCVK